MEINIILGELKNDGCDGATESCTFGEHPAVLAKLNLLANKSIHWPRRHLANESEHIQLTDPCTFIFPPIIDYILGIYQYAITTRNSLCTNLIYYLFSTLSWVLYICLNVGCDHSSIRSWLHPSLTACHSARSLLSQHPSLIFHLILPSTHNFQT
jgi:hypothetical protein